ncbi:SDR family oxidoreductase [Paraliomyxa miuraensis]|uniref:SDR family oxidoreductase n=1 Tax=Paraliomyxa miuraensis TaxID=376150 RepID=UPI00224FB796|nr:SDR family oxidoreductase [Paraliomyxa miuraensis]MCX4247408.1 SDR family oxidoreductase [Paraliomyxa miuraensis]
MSVLLDKVAIITGASSGIGRAAAKLFAREGAAVVVAARRRAELDLLVDEITRAGGRAVALAGDVADEAFASALVALAIERFGGLDVAFDNAGTLGTMGATTELTASEWERALAVNLTSAFFAAKHQIPAMLARGGGSIVFTSTFVGHTAGMPGMAAYAASKSGLIGLTQALATEFGPQGIRVNALLPGGTDTPMGRVVASTPEALDFVRRLHALRRIASPEEIARSALYLASDQSSFTTGIALLADGGVSIHRG